MSSFNHRHFPIDLEAPRIIGMLDLEAPRIIGMLDFKINRKNSNRIRFNLTRNINPNL